MRFLCVFLTSPKCLIFRNLWESTFFLFSLNSNDLVQLVFKSLIPFPWPKFLFLTLYEIPQNLFLEDLRHNCSNAYREMPPSACVNNRRQEWQTLLSLAIACTFLQVFQNSIFTQRGKSIQILDLWELLWIVRIFNTWLHLICIFILSSMERIQTKTGTQSVITKNIVEVVALVAWN